MAEEITYYNQDGVRVTNSRAIIRNKTYAMANITSVSRHTIPGSHTAELVIAFVALGLLSCGGISAMSALAEYEWGTAFSSGFGVLLGVGLLVLALRGMRISKDQYVIRLSAAGGEVDAFTSRDLGQVNKIADAISEAIIGRG